MRFGHRNAGYWIAATMSMVCVRAHAAQLQISVVDDRGRAVSEMVVVATASAVNANLPRQEATAVMDQVDKHFVPEVLVVRTGTAVSFPNSDSVAHQVYSFSASKRFALPLYRGRAHPPLVFDQPGVVVVGCNIHDQMVGYVYVTDSPYFAKSDTQGRVTFTGLAPGAYRVTAWHARLDERLAEQTIALTDAEPKDATFRLQRSLRPTPKPTDGRIRDY